MLNIRVSAQAKKLLKPPRKMKETRRMKPVAPAHANELWYRQQLLALVADLERETARTVTPVAIEAAERRMAQDAAPRKVADAIRKAEAKYKKIETLAEKTATKLVEKNLRVVDERLSNSVRAATGVDLKAQFVTTPGLKRAMKKASEENVELITSVPEEYFSKLRKRIGNAFETGMRPETLAKEIERVGEVTESRARLIARDQTAKMNSAFNQERQLSLGIEKYEWQTSGDERVREDHASKDGQTFRWDDPPSDTGHPGEDIQCRCVAVPLF